MNYMIAPLVVNTSANNLQRLIYLKSTINRYVMCGIEIPLDMIAEYNQLLKEYGNFTVRRRVLHGRSIKNVYRTKY